MEVAVGPEPRKVQRPRFIETEATTNLVVNFGLENVLPVDLSENYPEAEEIRDRLLTKLCETNGEVVPEHEPEALRLNLLLGLAHELRSGLDKGPHGVAASELFQRWNEVDKYQLDVEAFDLAIELNEALKRNPKTSHEIRLALRELGKDVNNMLKVPPDKGTLQTAHVEGVVDLVSEETYKIINTRGGGNYYEGSGTGDYPIVILMTELHDFVKLDRGTSLVWEHESLSTVASVGMLNELLTQLGPKLGLEWTDDPNKRKKVVMLLAKAIAGHGDQEYPHAQILRGGDRVQTETVDGVNVSSIEMFGAKSFFIEPPAKEKLLAQIPAEIQGDPAKAGMAVELLTRLRKMDREDGCGAIAERKYYLQYDPLVIFGYESWDKLIEEQLMASFAGNLKSAGFELDKMTSQERKVIYPTLLFRAMSKVVANEFDPKELKYNSERGNKFIFYFDQVAPFVGENTWLARSSKDDMGTKPGFVDGRRHYSFFQQGVDRLCQAEEIWRKQNAVAQDLKARDDQELERYRTELETTLGSGGQVELLWAEKKKGLITARREAMSGGKAELFRVMSSALGDFENVDFDYESNVQAAEMAHAELVKRLT